MSLKTSYTWATFKSAVLALMPVDAARRGTDVPLEFILRSAVTDIQNRVDLYRYGHVTTYSCNDVNDDGEASTGFLPEYCNPELATIVGVGSKHDSRPVKFWDWANASDLRSGAVRVTGGNGWIAFDPRTRKFLLYPKLANGWNMVLSWNGIKSAFADDDSVPFDEECVLAAYHKLKAYVAGEVDNDQDKTAASLSLYRQQLAKMYASSTERYSMSQSNQVPQRTNPCSDASDTSLCACDATCSEEEDEPLQADVAIISDYAGATEETAAVVQMMKQSLPDCIFTCGDNSIASPDLGFVDGDEGLLTDQVCVFFKEYIESEKFFPAWGNHDLGAGGLEGGQYGVPLMRLVPYVSDLNSGKKYYKKTVGPVSFFVLNSGFSDADPREDDGIGVGSDQVDWLTDEVAASDSVWNVVILHKTPYGSDEAYAPGDTTWRLDYRAIGVDLVLSGHQHVYERLLVDRVHFIVMGIGGQDLREWDAVKSPYRQYGKNDSNGFVRITATEDYLAVAATDILGNVFDRIRINA